MSASILPLDSDEHDHAQALLPWFVNGTLGEAEAGLVRAHVAGCGRCQADVAWQTRLREFPLMEAPAEGHVARDWARLRERLAGETTPEPPLRQRAPRAPAAVPWLRIAVGAQSVLVVLLLLALLVVLAPAWLHPGPRDDRYRAMGAAPPARANAIVVFRPEATEAQIRQALRDSDARVVDGPTVTGAYVLHLAASGAPALARLRAQGAVERAESLEAFVPP